MKTKSNHTRVQFFQDSILNWFRFNKQDFPWRKSGLSVYKLVISEILLQRTKAETVAKYYNDFIHLFPSWASLVQANIVDLENSIRPLGLFKQRSKRIKDLAYLMVERNGRFPKKREELEAIPMIGQYIASAILLLVYNKSEPLLDVNMARVLERFFGNRKLADIRDDRYLQNLSRQVVNHKFSRQINWGILDFAMNTCKKRRPKCPGCILSLGCIYKTDSA